MAKEVNFKAINKAGGKIEGIVTSEFIKDFTEELSEKGYTEYTNTDTGETHPIEEIVKEFE